MSGRLLVDLARPGMSRQVGNRPPMHSRCLAEFARDRSMARTADEVPNIGIKRGSVCRERRFICDPIRGRFTPELRRRRPGEREQLLAFVTKSKRRGCRDGAAVAPGTEMTGNGSADPSHLRLHRTIKLRAQRFRTVF